MLSYELFVEGMARLCEHFGAKPPELRFETYYQSLEEMRDEDFNLAVKDCTRTCKRMPFPADILERAEGSEKDDALFAYHEVLDAVRKRYLRDEIDDEIALEIVRRLGGWDKISDWTKEEWRWKQRDFVDLYRVLGKRVRERQEALPPGSRTAVGDGNGQRAINPSHEDVSKEETEERDDSGVGAPESSTMTSVGKISVMEVFLQSINRKG